MRIHHVQIMVRRGGEEDALRFYGDALGLPRIARPPGMPNPDGLWFAVGPSELHLGIDDRMPDTASRAHVALELDDLDASIERLEHAGFSVAPAHAIGALRRAHVRDPFGNRLELMGK